MEQHPPSRRFEEKEVITIELLQARLNSTQLTLIHHMGNEHPIHSKNKVVSSCHMCITYQTILRGYNEAITEFKRIHPKTA